MKRKHKHTMRRLATIARIMRRAYEGAVKDECVHDLDTWIVAREEFERTVLFLRGVAIAARS